MTVTVSAGPHAERLRGCNRTQLAGQINLKSWSFSPEAEYIPHILALKSGLSYDSHPSL